MKYKQYKLSNFILRYPDVVDFLLAASIDIWDPNYYVRCSPAGEIEVGYLSDHDWAIK